MSSTRLRNIALTVAAVAAIGVLVAVITGGGDAADEPRDPVSAPLEFFDGTNGNLADFAGTPVVVNFWASWCPACVAEMTDFGAVEREFGDRVVFLGLNVQEISFPAAVRLIEDTRVEYLMAHDRDGAIYRQFGGIAMPTTVFIGADGAVVRIHAGVLFADDLRRVIETDLLG